MEPNNINFYDDDMVLISTSSTKPLWHKAMQRLKIVFGFRITKTTHHFLQPPKLPIPDIPATLKRYLNAVETFTPSDDLEKTTKYVDQFLQDEDKTKEIMAFLEKKNEVEENWVYKWWLNDMYLYNMLPLPINSNPGWVFPKQNFECKEDMIKYVTKLVTGLGRFKQQIEKNELPIELAPGRSGGPKMALCTKQYERLLNAYRCPGAGQDALICSDALLPNENEHIIVMAYTHIYEMPIKKDGQWLSFDILFHQLMKLEQEAKVNKQTKLSQRVGLLTSESRDQWANARDLLLKEPTNEVTLKKIESCLFVVCLDDITQNITDVERSHKDMFKQMLTGMGTRYNGSNRWFDKTIQLVVSMDGCNGMCYEHTASEGVAVVTAMTSIFQYIQTLDDHEIIELNDDVIVPPYQKLEFKITDDDDDQIQTMIVQAGKKLDDLDADTDVEVFKFELFGKSFIKTCQCSPDAFMQMSLQLAYFRLNNVLCSTYESASTRRFHHGRVDSIRASHPEALKWAEAMLDETKDVETKKELFKAAIVKQTQVMKENIFGEGVDIPLLGIKNACQEIWPEQKFELFEDATFSNAMKFKLSTSQVPINLKDSYMGYGAVVPDGYGVSYNLQDNHVIFAISSFFSCQDTNSRRFTQAVDVSLKEMKLLFTTEKDEE